MQRLCLMQVAIVPNDPWLCNVRNWGTQCFRFDEYQEKRMPQTSYNARL